MFVERWLPLRQVPEETGAAGGTEAPASEAPVETPPSGPGSGRSELRQQLEKNFETDRKAVEKAEKATKKAKAPKRVAGGAEITEGEAPEAGAEAVEGAAEGEGSQQAEQTAVPAPEGLSAEAKAAWGQVPAPLQQAIAKRLEDSAKGVAELKEKYAELDAVIAPHMDVIRRNNQTPAKTVGRFFDWFQALAANPDVAFPALAKSFGHDIAKFAAVAAQQQQQPQPGNGADAVAGAVSPEVQKYINDLQAKVDTLQNAFTQKIGAVETALTQQTEAKTNEVLAMWSKDKPHFESVRQLMANLIASGAVPLKDGQVDLDTAYDMAIYANPQVRSDVLKAQQEAARKAAADKAAAEKKAQQEQADKARKAAVGLSGSAPGAPGAPGSKPTGKRKSVRESIMEAHKELTE